MANSFLAQSASLLAASVTAAFMGTAAHGFPTRAMELFEDQHFFKKGI
jgi:hypothetical protein